MFIWFLAIFVVVGLFLVGQICIYSRYSVTESIIELDSIIIRSRPNYDWRQLSNGYPNTALNFCEKMYFHIPRRDFAIDSKIKIVSMRLKSKITGDEVLLNLDNPIMRFNEDIDEFIIGVPIAALSLKEKWQHFTIALEVLFETDEKSRINIFHFEHQITRSKSYRIYFLEALSI